MVLAKVHCTESMNSCKTLGNGTKLLVTQNPLFLLGREDPGYNVRGLLDFSLPPPVPIPPDTRSFNPVNLEVRATILAVSAALHGRSARAGRQRINASTIDANCLALQISAGEKRHV